MLEIKDGVGIELNALQLNFSKENSTSYNLVGDMEKRQTQVVEMS